MSSNKHGRSGSQAGADSSHSPKKARQAPSLNPGLKPPKKTFHLTRSEVPEKAKEVKAALELHLRILWNLFSQEAVPTIVGTGLIATFNQRFKNTGSEGVQDLVDGLIDAAEPASVAVMNHVTTIKRAAHLGSAFIAKNVKRVDDQFLYDMFAAVARAGLQQWAPDVHGASDSLYNVLHERLAISTFKQVLSSFGYVFLGADISYAQNHILLTKFYKNFVFSNIAKKARSEEKRPGAVEWTVERNNAFRRRKHLAETRSQQLSDEGYRAEVVLLASEPDAHSDDELDAATGQYHIKAKCGRSPLVTNLFRLTDRNYRERMMRQRRRGQHTDRIRVVPQSPLAETATSPLPVEIPIDYFSPDYYNSMSLRERAYYMHNAVALPLDQSCHTMEQIQTWRRLSTPAFMQQYGNAKLALYNLPTAEELERLATWEEEDE